MTDQLYQLAYVSSARRPMYAPDLRDLLTVARSRNDRQRVTGMLLYKSERFMQVLEGQMEDVEAIFAAIKGDARHHRIWTLFTLPTTARNFARWSMGCYLLETGSVIELHDGTELRELDDERLKSDQSIARAVLDRFAQEPELSFAQQL